MTENLSFPNPKKVEQTVTQMREVCRQFDKLNLSLDEVIANIELHIRNSPLTAYRLGQEKPVIKSTEIE